MRLETVYKVVSVSLVSLGLLAALGLLAFLVLMGITSWLGVAAIEWLIEFVAG